MTLGRLSDLMTNEFEWKINLHPHLPRWKRDNNNGDNDNSKYENEHKN